MSSSKNQMIFNGIKSEWSPIQSVIKLTDSCEAGVQFVNPVYVYRQYWMHEIQSQDDLRG